MSYGFDFYGLWFEVCGLGVLWWLEGCWLIVVDLYFGKFEWMVWWGGLLLLFYEG